jgi:hypothetical protein
MLFLGLGTTCIIGVLTSNKLMRNNKVLVGLLIVSIAMTISQIVLSIHEKTFKRATLSDALYSPLVYVIFYNCLRHAYLRIFGIEPTYNRMSWYDPEDGRKQNWLDVIVYITPFFLSLGFPILLAILKN